MVRDRLRSDKVDRSREVGIGNGGIAANRPLPHKDVFTDSSQRLDGSGMENKPDDVGSSLRTERGYFGERPPRLGGYRGRRMNRGGFMDRFDRNRFDDGGRGSRDGFESPGMANEHSDSMPERVERNGFRAPRDQRGDRRGWRGRGGYRRPFLRQYPSGLVYLLLNASVFDLLHVLFCDWILCFVIDDSCNLLMLILCFDICSCLLQTVDFIYFDEYCFLAFYYGCLVLVVCQ